MMTCTYHQPTNKDLSPTQSVGSLILRPRSTPIRRATISAGSPSKQQPYMNVSEIWTSSLYDTARSTESNNSDGTSKHSSASSTMHSNDSGCATMYSSGDHFLPVTKSPSSQYINMHLEVHPDTGKGYTAMRSTLSFDRRFIDEQLFHGNLPEGGGEPTVYEFRACPTHRQGNSCRTLIK